MILNEKTNRQKKEKVKKNTLAFCLGLLFFFGGASSRQNCRLCVGGLLLISSGYFLAQWAKLRKSVYFGLWRAFVIFVGQSYQKNKTKPQTAKNSPKK